MPWFHVDDDAADHRKVLAAGNAAFGAWVRMGAWAAKNLTDGFIPRAQARHYASPAQIARLLKVTMLEARNGGYEIHDYLDANPTHTTIRAQRIAAAERKRRQRQRQNEVTP
jgi:hypothetical protein